MEGNSATENSTDPEFVKWNRDEIQMELSDLDESNERIERVSELFLMYNQDDAVHVESLCDIWMHQLAESDSHDRIPFLYVANHIIFKCRQKGYSLIPQKLLPRLPEAVSLVCTSPADRETVMRILKLWNEHHFFSLDNIRKMWLETGEPLPPFWAKDDYMQNHAEYTHGATSSSSSTNIIITTDVSIEPELPSALKARAAHPLLDILKRIDYAKHIVKFTESKLQDAHYYVMQIARDKSFRTADDICRHESPAALKAKVEACMQVLLIRNVRP
jgi:hypothetical protein